MKNISFPNAFANEWNDQSSDDALIDDKNVILTGPRWSILKDFHNKWEDLKSSSSMLTEDESLPDDFPRIIGDNNVVFAERPNNPNGELQVSSVTWLIILITLLKPP